MRQRPFPHSQRWNQKGYKPPLQKFIFDNAIKVWTAFSVWTAIRNISVELFHNDILILAHPATEA